MYLKSLSPCLSHHSANASFEKIFLDILYTPFWDEKRSGFRHSLELYYHFALLSNPAARAENPEITLSISDKIFIVFRAFFGLGFKVVD